MGLFDKRSEQDDIKMQLAELSVKLADVRRQVGELNTRFDRLRSDCVYQEAQSEDLEKYARKALAAGNQEDARAFLNEKQKHDKKLADYSAQLTQVAETRDKAVELHDQMVREINEAKTRLAVLEARNSAAAANMSYAKTVGSSKFEQDLSDMEIKSEYDMAMNDARNYADKDTWGDQ